MTVRTRRDVYNLEPWDDVLLWYARAVAHMLQRPETTPTSWMYQANVHGAVPEGQLADWDQCEHQTWFFLPWHRAYLYCWEAIVQAAIAEIGGPAGWSLPYWNYCDEQNPDARKLPQAFRDAKTPDGDQNPLLAQRNSAINRGGPIAKQSVNVKALDEPFFQGVAVGGSPGFGGVVTGFPHHGGGTNGALENFPHNAVHVDVGGLMLNPDTAAQDPIFWLHHANIDRLWSIWLANTHQHHANPTTGAWLNARYPLHDATGHAVPFTAVQVLDTTVAPLSYQYESLDDPRTAPAPPPSVSVPPHQQQPEMIGATDAPVVLASDHVHASLSLEPPTGPAVEAADLVAARPSAVPEGARIHLNLENVTGEKATNNYNVYVDVPEGDDPETHPELFAGVLAPFGIERASSRRDPHTGGSGLNVAFDITEVVGALQATGSWDPSHVRVSFVPSVGDDEPAPITVGRISVYVTR